MDSIVFLDADRPAPPLHFNQSTLATSNLLTPTEDWLIRFAVLLSATLSLIGSLAIICTAILLRDLWGRLESLRLVVFLSAAQLGSSLAWIAGVLSTWGPPEHISLRDRDSISLERSSGAVCVAQGAALQFFELSSILWISCFAFALFRSIWFPRDVMSRSSTLAKTLTWLPKTSDNFSFEGAQLESLSRWTTVIHSPEDRRPCFLNCAALRVFLLGDFPYHVVAWGLPAITVGILLGMHAFGDAILWCWISQEHAPDRFYFLYIPLWTLMLVDVVLYLFTVCRRRRTIKFQITLYVIVFLLCWTPASVNRIQNWAQPGRNLWWLFGLQAFFTPLQGFLNCLVYGFMLRPVRDRIVRRLSAGLRRLWILLRSPVCLGGYQGRATTEYDDAMLVSPSKLAFRTNSLAHLGRALAARTDAGDESDDEFLADQSAGGANTSLLMSSSSTGYLNEQQPSSADLTSMGIHSSLLRLDLDEPPRDLSLLAEAQPQFDGSAV